MSCEPIYHTPFHLVHGTESIVQILRKHVTTMRPGSPSFCMIYSIFDNMLFDRRVELIPL